MGGCTPAFKKGPDASKSRVREERKTKRQGDENTVTDTEGKQGGSGSGTGKPASPSSGSQPAAHKPGEPVHEVPLGVPGTPEQMQRRKDRATKPDPQPPGTPAQADDPQSSNYDPPEDK